MNLNLKEICRIYKIYTQIIITNVQETLFPYQSILFKEKRFMPLRK